MPLKTFRATFSSISDHHYLGRYSIEKLHLFDQYQRTASPLRVTAVILLTPVPTLLVLAAMDCIPLDDPRAGASGNTMAFVRSTLSHVLITFAVLLPLKQALALTHRKYSFATIAFVACCTALLIEALCIPLAFTWRFPVPFREMIGLPVFVLGVGGFNVIFAKGTMKRLWRRGQLQRYVPLVGIQLTLFYLFLGLSVGFAHLSLLPQTVMILVFPFVKMLLKHLVWKYGRHLSDISTDVTMCMLEVSGALYQTVCIQFVDSPVLNVLIVLSDVLQAIHEVRTYTQVNYLTDGQQTVNTALKIVTKALAQAARQARRSSTLYTPTSLPTAREGKLSTHSLTMIAHTEFTSFPRALEPIMSLRFDALLMAKTSSDQNTEQLFAGRSVYIPPSRVRLARCAGLKQSRRLLDLNGTSSGRSTGRQQDLRGDQQDLDGDVDSTTGTPTTTNPTHSCNIATHASPQSITTARPQDKLPRSPRHGLRDFGYGWLPWRHAEASKIYAITDVHSSLSSSTNAARPPLPEENRATTTHHQHQRLRYTRHGHPTTAVWIDGVHIAQRHHARMLEQTLQLLFASEVLLFAEYMEVVVPVLFAAWLGSEWLSPNAQYNVMVASMTGERVTQEIWTAALYAVLELVSLMAMYWFMRYTYGVSALYQLAFVLEKYWMTLQGKLVGSFIVLLNALTIHQGAGGV